MKKFRHIAALALAALLALSCAKETQPEGAGEMERYLRPETLFGTKFEGYLNARVTTARRGSNGVSLDNRTADELDAIF